MISFWDIQVGQKLDSQPFSDRAICKFGFECIKRAIAANRERLNDVFREKNASKLSKHLQLAFESGAISEANKNFVLSLRPPLDSQLELVPEVKYSIFGACYFLDLIGNQSVKLVKEVAFASYMSQVERSINEALHEKAGTTFDDAAVFAVEAELSVCQRVVEFQRILLNSI